MNFNRRLEEAILAKFKNIKQFAEAVGISANLIRAYVKGESIPSIDKVKDMAKELGVSLDCLVYGKESNNYKEDLIIDLINIIHERVDYYLNIRNKEMDLDKKSILVKIIYKQLKEQQSESKEKIIEQINNAISILDVA